MLECVRDLCVVMGRWDDEGMRGCGSLMWFLACVVIYMNVYHVYGYLADIHLNVSLGTCSDKVQR